MECKRLKYKKYLENSGAPRNSTRTRLTLHKLFCSKLKRLIKKRNLSHGKNKLQSPQLKQVVIFVYLSTFKIVSE